MSKNINQIYIANPASSAQSTDLMYVGRSPYGAGDDYAITFNSLQTSITAVGIITSGQWESTTAPIGVAYGGTGATSFSANSILFSNGSVITQDNANFSWTDSTYTLSIIQPSSLATLNTVLYVESDPSGSHGHGNHVELAGNPGGGATIFRTDGGLNKSWIQIYGGDSSGTNGGALYVNGNNSTGGGAGGVQTTFGLTTSTFDMYDNTQSVLLFSLNNAGVLQLPNVTASSALATDASSNVVASLTTATELGYVHGVTSSIQAQIDAIAAFTWSVQTANAALVKNKGYFANSASALGFTLPTTAAVGDTFEIAEMSTGTFTVNQNAGQSIIFGNLTTTTGTGGSIASTTQGAALKIVCNVANVGFQVVTGTIGNFNVI